MLEEDKSLFNAGIAKLKRIDQIKIRMHYARENKQFGLWLDCLSGWREEMSKRMEVEHNDEADKIEDAIREVMITRGLEHMLRSKLKEYGMYLSKLEFKFGLSMPNQDSAMNALN